ncbi:hypothetical protein AAZX31_17G161500 [Glycine max]
MEIIGASYSLGSLNRRRHAMCHYNLNTSLGPLGLRKILRGGLLVVKGKKVAIFYWYDPPLNDHRKESSWV